MSQPTHTYNRLTRRWTITFWCCGATEQTRVHQAIEHHIANHVCKGPRS